MKRFFSILSLVFVAMMAISCYDDTKVWEKINSLETQLTELTTQVNSVATLVAALENNNYIKAVTEVAGGYEIEFTNGEKITIKDGENGADAPEIGAVKDTDGVYYWTLDSEWLLDAEGNRIPAGMGQPKLKTEDGQWYISADGKEWALVGPNVACTIKNVEVAENAVTFTLADGTEIVVPVFKGLDITFNVAAENLYDSQKATFEYTIVGGTENNRVAAMCDGASVKVTPTDVYSGTITVENLNGADYEVVVWVTDGVSATIFKTVKYVQGTFTTESDVAYVGFDEGTFVVPIATNIEYTASVEEGCDWITLPVETKAPEVRNEEVVFNIAANQALTPRSAKVYLTPTNVMYNALTITVTVTQKGHAELMWTKVPTKDYTDFTAGPVRLASYGEYILVSNTNKIFAINPEDGSLVTTYELPDGLVCNSLCVDEGGNILISADAKFSWSGSDQCETLYVYMIDSLESQPELLVKYSTANIWGDTTGNIRVSGNVDEKALIVAAASGASYWVTWVAENGAVENDANGWSVFTSNTAPYTFGSAQYGIFMPAGTELSDGLWYVAYGGDYTLQFCDTATNTWTSVASTGNNGNYNTASLALTELAGRSCAIVFAGAHFNYADPYLTVFDVTDKTASTVIYNLELELLAERNADWSLVNWTAAGAYSDIIATDVADGVDVYFIDSNFNMLGRIAVR